MEAKTCPNCDSLFTPIRPTSKYCSRKCAWANNGGHNRKPETWWVNSRGYVEGKVWIDEHTLIRTKQHRWLMEKHLGRRLLPSEDIHHLNGNKTDNRIENLEIIDHITHAKLHAPQRPSPKGRKLTLSESERQRRRDHMQRIGSRPKKG